jgi:hypothetical protein
VRNLFTHIATKNDFDRNVILRENFCAQKRKAAMTNRTRHSEVLSADFEQFATEESPSYRKPVMGKNMATEFLNLREFFTCLSASAMLKGSE